MKMNSRTFAALLGSAIAAYASDPDIRALTWGMSKEAVVSSEGKPSGQYPGDTLAYQVALDGSKAAMFLEFVDDQLATVSYVLLDSYTEPNRYLEVNSRWRAILTEKYGKPKTTTPWTNPLYVDNPDKYGLAISAGHLKVINEWATDRSDVRLSLSGDNFKTSLLLTYASKDLAAALKKKKTATNKSVF